MIFLVLLPFAILGGIILFVAGAAFAVFLIAAFLVFLYALGLFWIGQNFGGGGVIFTLIATALLGALIFSGKKKAARAALAAQIQAEHEMKIRGLREERFLIEESQADETKKCPYCAELIKKEAKVCRFCGREMPAKSHQARDN